MLINDDPTDKRPTAASGSPAPYGQNGYNKDNLIERTRLPLPSLPELDQIPFPPVVSPISTPIPNATEPDLDQIPFPPIVSPISTPIPNTADKTEEARRPDTSQAQPTNRHENTWANTTAIRNLKLPTFVITILLCLLSLGAGAAIYAYATMPTQGVTPLHALTTPDSRQRRNSPFASNLLGTGSFRVGEQPTFILHGQSGNVTIIAGKVGAISVKINNEGSDRSFNAQGINYSRSYDSQKHDVITMTVAPELQRLDLAIEVPASAQLQVIVNSGLISVTGVAGANIDANSGNLDIERISKFVHAYTTNGDIMARNLSGQTTMETVNGSIRATTISGKVTAITQNGDIILRQAALADQSTLKTTYGSVYFNGSLDPRGTYTLGTHNGNVNLTLPANTLLQLQAKTNSGPVSNKFEQNTTGARVIINIGNGSITIRKAL